MSKKKKKTDRKKLIKKLLMGFIVVFIVYNLITFYFSPQMSMIAHTQTIEVKYDFDGIISRIEKTIDIDMSEGGLLDTVVGEHEMVKKGTLIATHYDSNIDDELRNELNIINKKIAQLKATPSNETGPLTQQEIKDRFNSGMNELTDVASSRDVIKIKTVKSDIEIISEENSIEVGEVSGSVNTLDKLLIEKSNIESNYKGEKKEILSPVHGIFSSSIDGYESILDIEKSKEMKVSDYENLLKRGAVSEESKKNEKEETPDLKIVDSFSWAVSVYADEEKAKNFSVGENITIRFGGEKEEAKARIEYISPAESGKYIITAVSDTYSQYAMINRFAKLTFVKAVYSGLYVPVEAIRVKDGVTGVYVKTENTMKYKAIDVIYKNEEDAIVKINNTKSNALLLYDEIIVN